MFVRYSIQTTIPWARWTGSTRAAAMVMVIAKQQALLRSQKPINLTSDSVVIERVSLSVVCVCCRYIFVHIDIVFKRSVFFLSMSDNDDNNNDNDNDESSNGKRSIDIALNILTVDCGTLIANKYIQSLLSSSRMG